MMFINSMQEDDQAISLPVPKNHHKLALVVTAVVFLALGAVFAYKVSLVDGHEAYYWKNQYETMAARVDKCEQSPVPTLSPASLIDLKIDNCINQATEVYKKQWLFKCEQLGKEAEAGQEACALPTVIYQELNNQLAQEKEFCVKRYKE